MDQTGRIGRLDRVPGIGVDGYAAYAAITPDGSRLAFPTRTHRVSPTGIDIVALADGHVQKLTTSRPGSIFDLSWAADGRRLAFRWHPHSGEGGGVYLVDTATAGDLLDDSRHVAETNGELGLVEQPLVSADARHLYVTAAQAEPTGGPHWNRLLEISVEAPSRPRVLFEMRYEPNRGGRTFMWRLVCRDTPGRHLLVFTAGYAHRIDIAGGTTERIPFPKGKPYSAAW